MKNMKKIKIGTFLLRVGFVIYILENFYFGWNEKSMSDMESYADNVVVALFYMGFILYLMPVLSIYEDYVKRNED